MPSWQLVRRLAHLSPPVERNEACDASEPRRVMAEAVQPVVQFLLSMRCAPNLEQAKVFAPFQPLRRYIDSRHGVPLIFVRYTGLAGPWPHAGLRVDPNNISN